jgi:outer membrane immunogenic protein
MKKLVFAAAILAINTAGTMAADMPLKAPAYAPAAAYNWSGWYWGLNAGGNWGRSRNATTFEQSAVAPTYAIPAIPALNAIGAPASIGTSGFTGGVHGGYNWQSGNFLAGFEVDFEYFRNAGSRTATGAFVPPLAPAPIAITSSVSTDWLFTARPRLGFAVNNWLFYGTGGLAVTQVKASWNYIGGVGPETESASASSTRAGWIVGGGIETVLTKNWLIGAEYLHADFGNLSSNGTIVTAGGLRLTNPVSHSADLTSNIVRVRVSQKF